MSSITWASSYKRLFSAMPELPLILATHSSSLSGESWGVGSWCELHDASNFGRSQTDTLSRASSREYAPLSTMLGFLECRLRIAGSGIPLLSIYWEYDKLRSGS
ncbi:uncharacterized protein K489DRAFT_367472 [Dissoconium aciculare CBS 342.82]|uniref:Uncharacterized protein n=1 Tax=Dissoconium aciculare CBS 342.82 TaxID=1314786 RepID=A0A6J3MF16_9PEZI|nr:uncharacterized protein K489DRAFT_367472 [Dissoconium aciculare CBS 342.82]KAF1826234.1 hypothetical protein K489DRAFT_367472 [Dissoconium aciculare CBS 342.82]